MCLCYQPPFSLVGFVPLDFSIAVSSLPTPPFSLFPPAFILSSTFNILLVNVVFYFFYHSCWSISFCGSKHFFFSNFLSVKNTVSQSFLGYHSSHVNYPFSRPSVRCKLLLTALENRHNLYSWVIILYVPSSLLFYHHSLFFSMPPSLPLLCILCFVPSYTMEWYLRTDPQGCDSNFGFCYLL